MPSWQHLLKWPAAFLPSPHLKFSLRSLLLYLLSLIIFIPLFFFPHLFSFFTLLHFTLLYFTLLYFTLLYFTLLFCWFHFISFHFISFHFISFFSHSFFSFTIQVERHRKRTMDLATQSTMVRAAITWHLLLLLFYICLCSIPIVPSFFSSPLFSHVFLIFASIFYILSRTIWSGTFPFSSILSSPLLPAFETTLNLTHNCIKSYLDWIKL